MKILSVDDNPTNRKLLRALLESEGHAIVDASDGVEALSVLESNEVDVVISDILMPNMDGYKLCYEIRHSERLGHLPFIAYTSTYISPSDERLALEVGADKYLRKPAQAQALVDLLYEFETDPVYRRRRSVPTEQEQHVMKAYSQVLVDKLQERNAELEVARVEIMKMNEDLERRVSERTAQLEIANQELEAFSHSAAHDLRAPLRTIEGNGFFLKEFLGAGADAEALDYIERIRSSAKRMNDLIDDLLKLSHVGRCDVSHERVDLSLMAHSIANELRDSDPAREVEFSIEPGMEARGDQPLLRIALTNLLGNAWKFTANVPSPRVEFRSSLDQGKRTLCVTDNGVGFNMAHVDKLFKPFERLHTQTKFPGTGLGLTIVKRILDRHEGAIWIESAENVGTSVYFTLA
jgi:signal transduction histidine kinase